MKPIMRVVNIALFVFCFTSITLVALLTVGWTAEQGYWELQGEPKLEATHTSGWADQNRWEGKIISFDKTHVSYAFRHPNATKGVWTGGKMEWDPLPGILIPGQRIPARLKIEGQGTGLTLIGGGSLPIHLLLGKVGEIRNDPQEKPVSKGNKGAVAKIGLNTNFSAINKWQLTYTYHWKEGAPPKVPPISPPPEKPVKPPPPPEKPVKPIPPPPTPPPTPPTPSPTPPSSKWQTDFLGQWKISIGGPVGRSDERKVYYSGTISFTKKDGKVSGYLRLTSSGEAGPLDDVVLSGNKISFKRPLTGVTQYYRGEIVAQGKIDGTIDHKGSKARWWATK